MNRERGTRKKIVRVKSTKDEKMLNSFVTSEGKIKFDHVYLDHK